MKEIRQALLRLKMITVILIDYKKYLKSKIFSKAKKYFRTGNIVDGIDTVLITISVASGAGGIGLLSTIVAIPVVIALEVTALVSGLVSIFRKYFVKTTRTKGEKHLKIKMIADAKLDTIYTHISRALIDNHISDEELKLIMEELDKYKTMKNEIRSRFKNKITAENEETLIERGRKEARDSFRKLVEKSNA